MVKIFIRKGILTLCLNLSILLIGFFTWPYMSNEFIPSIQIPAVAVIFPTPFLPRERIENEIVTPVAQNMWARGDIESMESYIQKDKTIIVLFYKWKFAPSSCLRKARQVIENIPRKKDILSPIFVLYRPSNKPIYRNVIYGKNVLEVSKEASDLALKLERIPGISKVEIRGKQLQKTIVNLKPNKLAEFQITPSKILKNSRESWSFRQYFKGTPLGHYIHLNLKDNDDLGMLTLHSGKTDGPILLRWLADIRNSSANPKVIYGQDSQAVIMEIIKSPGADTISIINKAQKISSVFLEKTKNIKSKVIYDEGLEIIKAQHGVLKNFLLGVLLNSFILVIFLGSSIGALVASVVFPTTLLGTLFVQKSLGIGLNLFSLNGFSLAVGMITDASTVVLESINRRFRLGEELFSSCWRGTKDVGLGVVASTLTTAGVLIPITMQKNVSGKLFSDLSFTVVSTQLLCLIAVFSLVPWLCFKIFKKNKGTGPAGLLGFFFKRTSFLVNFMIGISLFLQKMARRGPAYKWGIPSFVILLNLLILLFIPATEFLPPISSKTYSLNYPLEHLNTSSKKAVLYRNRLASMLNKRSDILWSVSSNDSNNVEILFKLKNYLPKNVIKGQFKDDIIDIKKINIQSVAPTSKNEKFGYDGLFYISHTLPLKKRQEFINEFCSNKMVDNCLNRNFYRINENQITPLGLTSFRMGSSGIDTSLQMALYLKEIDLISLGNLSFPTPLVMKMNYDRQLLNAPISLGKYNTSALGGLFKHKYRESYSDYLKYNWDYCSPLYFKIKKGTLGQMVSLMKKSLKKLDISSDKVIRMRGLKTMQKSFQGLIEALIMSAIIIFIILAIQFKSIRKSLIIMLTIPLTMGGAILGILVMGETINASVMVGIILLIGIVVNNGIFLVEATNHKVLVGEKVSMAVQMAITERTRPILMTSLSTIFGMLPTIVIGGEGSEIYRGMAIVNVFGMVFGTILSILITPILLEHFGGRYELRTKRRDRYI